MRERLELDISAAAPGGTKVKVTAPVNPTERRHAVWIGELAERHYVIMDHNDFCLPCCMCMGCKLVLQGAAHLRPCAAMQAVRVHILFWIGGSLPVASVSLASRTA
jgi:hypothetical protein